MRRAPLAAGAPRPARRTTVAGRSPGSRISAALRLPGVIQWRDGARLPGHSCGGSAGFDPLPSTLMRRPGLPGDP